VTGQHAHLLTEVADRNPGYAAHHRHKPRKIGRLLRRRSREQLDVEDNSAAWVKPLCAWLVQPGLLVTLEADLSITILTEHTATGVLDLAGLMDTLAHASRYRDHAERTVIWALQS
jgi:hypothetical protein